MSIIDSLDGVASVDYRLVITILQNLSITESLDTVEFIV